MAALGAVLSLAAGPGMAQTKVVPPPGLEDAVTPPPPGGVSVSSSGRMVMSSSLCPALAGVAAVPGAEYTPGVDVHGNAVAPADLPSTTRPLAVDNFPIEISVNLQRRYGIPANSTLFHGKAIIGYVTVKDGRAYFNGQPISDNEQDMLNAACKERAR